MKEFFKDIAQDKTIAFAVIVNTLIVIATIAYILFSYGKLPPFVPIFNQLPWGEQRLGNTFAIFIPAFVALLIFSVNIPISTIVYNKTPLISRMLFAISLLVGILTFLFTIKTIALII